MNEKETINFYNRESLMYSTKRYASVSRSYYQYFFMRRLALCLLFLHDIEPFLPKDATLLEIGCADGVVMRAIEKEFPGRFSSLVGIDIAPEMLGKARELNTNPHANFVLRGPLSSKKYDVIIELGVVVPDIVSEFEYVNGQLNQNGYFLYSLDGLHSLHTLLKMRGDRYPRDFKAYMEYEKLIAPYFVIRRTALYALFIPKLWAVRIIGRIFQPMFDFVFQKITPELFHEQIYLLQSKTKQ